MNSSGAVNIRELLVGGEQPVRAALEVLDRCGLGVALVCDEIGRLESLITDGDVRRFLLRGGSLDAPARDAANAKYDSVGVDMERTQAIQLMLDRRFNCLPVVDDDGRPIDLHTLRTSLIGQRCDSWALVLAGGQGRRMGVHTEAMPKPMLPIGDRPILAHVVEHLVSHGVRRIFVAVNYLGQMIKDYFGDGREYFCRIEYLWEKAPLGTGGPLGLLPEAPTAPLVVMNGDLLTRINISRMLAFHNAAKVLATVAIRKHTIEVPFGVAEVRAARLSRLDEKPNLDCEINAGIYALSPEIVSRVRSGQSLPITSLINDCLANDEPIGAYRMSEPWNDIGRPEDLGQDPLPPG